MGKIFRPAEKSENRQIIDAEKQRRGERYRNLYLKKREREEREKEEAKQKKKDCQQNIGLVTAERDFQNIASKADELSKRALKKEESNGRKTTLKKEATKDLESQREVSNLANDPKLRLTPLKVGKVGSKFLLRGQLPEGETSKPKEKGDNRCLSRDQWLRELTPKREKIKPDVEIGLRKSFSPDDPNLILFQPQFGQRYAKPDTSAVREFRLKPLGRHYKRVLRKPIKFRKPHLRYTVKKFNLVGYRYGDPSKALKGLLSVNQGEKFQWKSVDEFIANKEREEQRHLLEKKLKRLQLLGIPCRPPGRPILERRCQHSETESDRGWIPEKAVEGEENERERERNLRQIMPLERRSNMPAPQYREPTLRQHPKRPRNYTEQRVPSEIFDQVVKTTTVPYMYKLPGDIVDRANANSSRRKTYTEFLESRHHHDHWNPTQSKYVDVHYQPEIVRPKIVEIKGKSQEPRNFGRSEENRKFVKAQPPCQEYVDKNLTMPEWDMEELRENFRKEHGGVGEAAPTQGTLKIENRCHQKDFVFHSRDPRELEDLQYPGREEYLKFMQEIKQALGERDSQESPLEFMQTPLLQEFQEDLKSIESCLSSLSSSQCTNLTNDSGSHLLLEGQEKIPLDFIRKSLVPFEELQRSRFQAEPIDVEREEQNPFRVLPFSGQRKAQLELSRPRDKFFTFNSRLKNGLRLRLQVAPKEEGGKSEETLVGKGARKHKPMMATDIDENYINVVKNRPAVKMFNYKTSRLLIKDALRLKFESMLIQGQMVRTKIYDRLNEHHWVNMQQLKLLYDKLFDKWEKAEYDASMAVVYKVKAYYDETDSLKTELKNLERNQGSVTMDIVFTEAHWVRCTMLQNFHYLLGDHEWRLQHDWIHRITGEPEDSEGGSEKELDNPEGSSLQKTSSDSENSLEESESAIQLENYEQSILKRSKVNIRPRDKDDAWAIKSYYEEVYLPNKHPNLIVFPSAESFLQGLENLKSKTFVLLLEMHFTLAIHTELQNRVESFEEWCRQDLKEKREYVARKCSKLYFMQDRAAWLRSRVLMSLQRPIEESFNDVGFLKDYGLISEAWRRIVPSNVRGSNDQMEAVEMVAMMSDVVMELIGRCISLQGCIEKRGPKENRPNFFSVG